MKYFQVIKNVRQVAANMPAHPRIEGKPKPAKDGSTSDFGKHSVKMLQWVDAGIETIEEHPMSTSELKENIADFFRTWEGYGSRGGKDWAPGSATRIFSRMVKEGLIVELK